MALEMIVVQHREKERLPGDPGPTSRGHEEAAATAGLLASNGGAVALYSSPLRRATKTAEYLAASWGRKFARPRRTIGRSGSAPLDQSYPPFRFSQDPFNLGSKLFDIVAMTDYRLERRIWRRIPRDDRRRLVVMARLGQPHPDAGVRRDGVEWAKAVLSRPLLLPLVANAVYLVTWSLVFSAFAPRAAILFGVGCAALTVAFQMRWRWRSAKEVLACNHSDDGMEANAPVRPTWLDRSPDNVAFGAKLWHKFALGFLVLTMMGVLAIMVVAG